MLYIVGTPIGNLKDVTFRAIETLKSVDYIACEDTRHSAVFLNSYEIKKPLISYHKFNERECAEKLVEILKSGKNVALISDAGMPIISDPGSVLIQVLIENGLEYTVVPGASAFTSALALSGLDASKFTFLGFLPEKQGERKQMLEKYKDLDTTLIFYSAPHDVKKDVLSLYSVFGDRKAVSVREITKMHETVNIFSLKEGYLGEERGEFVILVDGKKEDFSTLSEEEHIKLYLDKGLDKKEALKRVAKERGVSKSSLYKYTIEEK